MAAVSLLLCAAAPEAPHLPARYLAASEPADGAHLKASPPFIVLTMNGDVVFANLTLTDAEGRRWPLRWAPHEDAGPGIRAFIPQKLPKGTYTMRWLATWAEGTDEDIAPPDRKPLGPVQTDHMSFTVDQ